MFFKKKKTEPIVKRKTIFSIPSDEAKKYLCSITNDVNEILKNEKFNEATKRVKLPEGSTIADYEKAINYTFANKIYNFMSLFVDDCYDNIRRILACVFVTEFEEYKKKSLDEMCEDIASLSTTEIARVIDFFRH